MVVRHSLLWLAWCALYVVGASTYAAAQTASQITPRTDFQPPVSGRAGVVIPESSGQSAPTGADKLHVRISKVIIEGDTESEVLKLVADEKAKIVGRLADKRVSVADIFAAAQDFEKMLVKEGYPLMRVVVPAQHLMDGQPVRLVVVDGYIFEVETKGLPRQLQRRIKRVLTPLIGKRSVTLSEIERRLLLAGDTPGGVIRSTLSAGAEKGAAKLTIDDAKFSQVNGSVSLTNNLSPSMGRLTLNTNLALNSPLGLGERIQFNAAGSPRGGSYGFFGDDPSVRMLGGAIMAPIGVNGLALMVDAQNSKALSRNGRNGPAVSRSRYEHLSVGLSYPLIRRRDLIMTKTARFDINDELVALAVSKLPLSEDRMRVLRFSSDTTWFTPWDGVWWGKAVASFGLDHFGARSAKDASPLLPLSRQGADATFQKLEVGMGYSQTLAKHLGVDFTAMAQTSFGQPLVNSEQFGLTGSTALSSFDSGSIQGDAGGYMRLEISSPWLYSLPTGPLLFKPYAFIAGGLAHLEMPTALETGTVRAASFGAGLVFTHDFTNTDYRMNLAMEWGQQLRSDKADTDDRFNLELRVSF